MCSSAISCPVCYKSTFSDIQVLQKNLINAVNGPISCPICNIQLQGLDKLTIHLFCHVCNISDNHTSNYISSIPEAKIKTKAIVSVNDKNSLKCGICGLNFRSIHLLKMHDRIIHQLPKNVDSKSNLNGFSCHICQKTFKMNGTLRIHLKGVHDLEVAKLNDKFDKNVSNIEEQPSNTLIRDTIIPNLQKEQIIQDNTSKVRAVVKPWVCDVCQKSFTTKYFLKKHKRIHTGEMPYTCRICSKMFTFQQSYHKHLLYHNDEKPYTCQTCGRSFKEISTLHNHERIHSGEKPFKCGICGKCFRQRISYLVHSRIHTGVMPYTCIQCNRSFRYKASQRNHKCNNDHGKNNSLGKNLPYIPDNIQVPHEDNIDNFFIESNLDIDDYTKDEGLLTKSIDDIIIESCNRLGINCNEDLLSNSETSQELALLSLPAKITDCYLSTSDERT